jgi:hypothetical protein
VRPSTRHGRRLGATAAAAAAAVFIAVTLSNPSPASLQASRPPAAPSDPSVRGGSPASALESVSSREESPADAPASEISNHPFSPFAEASAPGGQKLPADATIYDWNPGGGQPRVVWIVDRSLDI